MPANDQEVKQAKELKERVCKTLKMHRDLTAQGKFAAAVPKMNDLLEWLEKQEDPAWWLKNQKHCDSSRAGLNALWQDYQLDSFGEVTEREVVPHMA